MKSLLNRGIFYKETHDYPWWNNGDDYLYANSQAAFHYEGELIHDKDEEQILKEGNENEGKDI